MEKAVEMKRSFVQAMIMFMLIIGAFVFILGSQDADGIPLNQTKLYLVRSPRILTTEIPEAGLTSPLETIAVGGSVSYDTPYPLTTELEISGELKGGANMIKLHLESPTITPGTSGMEMTMELLEVDQSDGERTLASAEIEQSSMTSSDYEMAMIGSSEAAAKGSYLRLRITITKGSGLLPTFQFLYSSGGEHSFVEMLADPIHADGVKVGVFRDGQEVDEVMPNGPANARTVIFSAGVRDAFGAYDLESIEINLTNSAGDVILDVTTDDPQPSGGQEWAYFNHTYTVPENLPEGDYNLRATGRSWTGQEALGEMTLKVTSGLIFSLIDPSPRNVDAGDVTEFEASVINGGTSSDRVTFSGTSERGWAIQFPPESEIAGGEEIIVSFRVSVPIDAPVGTEDELTFKAGSRNSGKEYESTGSAIVAKAATFSLEVIGQNQAAVLKGTTASYGLKLRNIENSSNSYELSLEDPPRGVTSTFSGKGVTQGAVYWSVNVGPGEILDLALNVTAGTGSDEGRHDLRAFARQRGETEKRYAYLTLTVVDDQKATISARGGTVSHTASRSGNTYPVAYRQLSFVLDLYNPTLASALVYVTSTGPEGWDVSGDFSSMELAPGENAAYNLSVTPARGEEHTPSAGKTVTVSMEGIGDDSSLDLEVKIPRVTDIKMTIDRIMPIEGKAGSEAVDNITVMNHGNYNEDVSLSLETPEDIIGVITPTSLKLAPGDSGDVMVKISLPASEKDENYELTVKATAGGNTSSLPLEIHSKGEKQKLDTDLIMIISISVFIVLLAMVGAFAYFRLGKKQSVQQKPQASPEVKERPSSGSTRPLSPPPDDESVRRADMLSRQALGEEPVEAEILE